MKLFIIRLILILTVFLFPAITKAGIKDYRRTEAMIPMRDGTKLYTVIFTPRSVRDTFPILIQRTPYGAFRPPLFFPYQNSLGKEGYIFVYQDIRGKYRSEGKMEIHTPLLHLQNSEAVDESTDTYDTIDWLIKNTNSNGKVGLVGISYPGWLAMVGSVDPHPALKAISPQGQMGDLFLGDDFHHNGAFRLSYGMEYTYEVEGTNNDGSFPFPQVDLFDWYMDLGSLKNVNDQYFHRRIPTWNHFIEHPDYDSFWVRNSPLSYYNYPSVPTLHVGGYYDQEDILGPQLMYQHLEARDSFNRNFICLGPWYHGQWSLQTADSIGKIGLGSNTASWFQQLQLAWFEYWLKGKGDDQFKEVYSFQTGSNTWHTYEKWPPSGTKETRLYLHPNGSCSFKPPTEQTGKISFISDPANPVPYRSRPIEPTYAPDSRWRPWQVEDQRFLNDRTDVISMEGEEIQEAVTVTGTVKVHLSAATSGTDADWVVKLIDVYPEDDTTPPDMAGYQQPVAMEVFRGRYRNSFSQPAPLKPNEPTVFEFDLHAINHVFKKGHRMMIQIQSSWFPVIDRNPQQFVPNIFLAEPKDYISQTHSIFCNANNFTYLTLPISGKF